MWKYGVSASEINAFLGRVISQVHLSEVQASYVLGSIYVNGKVCVLLFLCPIVPLTFVTTNYDLLIELAAHKLGIPIAYGLPAPPNNLPILKIHGSCNFLPDLKNVGFRGLDFNTIGFEGAIVDAPPKFAQIPEVLQFCETEDTIAPSLAMYAPGKRVLYCKTWIQNLQNAWKVEVKKSKRIYVIGLRVHPIDDHIWGVLAQSRCDLYFVGGEPDVFIEWARQNNRKKSYVLAEKFDQAIPKIARHLNSKWRPKS